MKFAKITFWVAGVCGAIVLATMTFGTASATSAASQSAVNGSRIATEKQEVVNVEERWLANEGNPAVLETILAADFVHVFPGGFFSKKQHIDYVRMHPQPKYKVHKFEKLEVRIYGNVAIANGTVLAVTKGDNATLRTDFTDVFVLRYGRWQAVNAQESPESTPPKP